MDSSNNVYILHGFQDITAFRHALLRDTFLLCYDRSNYL